MDFEQRMQKQSCDIYSFVVEGWWGWGGGCAGGEEGGKRGEEGSHKWDF